MHYMIVASLEMSDEPFIVRVDILLIVPCRPYPLGWHADKLEYEGFDAAGLL